MLLVGVAPILILPFLLAPAEYRPFALALAVVAAAVLAYRMPEAYARNTERQVRRLYGGGEYEGLFGRVELELTETHLIKRTATSESSTRLEALGQVVVTEDYTFIYASPVTAFVIPRHAVGSGDYDGFAEAVSQAVAAAKRGRFA
jgi:hypothetical protein